MKCLYFFNVLSIIVYVSRIKIFYSYCSNILQIVVPPLPGKALKRQLPFRGDDGIFEEEFIEDRRKGKLSTYS